MDYETLINCFVACFQHYKTDEIKVFVVHSLRNDIVELVKFLNNNKDNKEWHISFNGLAFDSQITEYILKVQDGLVDGDPEFIANELYNIAQDTITRSNAGEFALFSPRDLSIEQIDVYKLNHWDNPAKRSSLKWIEYSMDWYNIQEMPIHHSTFISSMEQIDQIISYCINDVRATKNIMVLSKSQINLRQTLTQQYGINLYSASEPRIAKELFLHFLSNKLNVKKYDLKQLRTKRNEIRVNDIILPYVKFETKGFQKIHEEFKTLVIDPNNTKGGFSYSVNYKGVRTDFGLGGVHGARQAGVYEAKDGMLIITSDVTSFYPNLAIRNKWAPAHIPKEEFCEQYEWFFNERKVIPKKDPRNYVYKIILNSTYGLSNDENSFLYDPEFTMRITINGQLSLIMLYEMISMEIPGSIPLMQNTDGLETMIPEKYKDKYFEICKRWEQMTNLELEHGEYSKIVLADVNNYIAINKPKKVSFDEWEAVKADNPDYIFYKENDDHYYQATKCKGRFEFSNLALHKNKSYSIIPKAIYNYFAYGTIPEKYLSMNRNILDYCSGLKAKGDWVFYQTCVVYGDIFNTPLNKIVRAYISDDGCKIFKQNKVDSRTFQVEAGAVRQTVYNIHSDKKWPEYNVNDSFYINKIYKEISKIEGDKNNVQLSIF